jgi:hypothetical protein
MSALWPLLLGGAIKPQDAAPTWVQERITPQITNEGDPVTVQYRGINLKIGNRSIMWFTDPLAPAGNWVENWETVIRREVAAKGGGLTVTKLTPTSVPKAVGYLDLMFTVNDKYVPGTRYDFTNPTRKNRADNQSLTLPDGTKGRNVQILIKAIPTNEGGAVANDGRVSSKGGSYNYVRDTSRTPLGQPKIDVRSLGAGGGAAVATVQEGDQFRIDIVGTNVTPGTVLKTYFAGLGQYDVTPGLRAVLSKACADVGCVAKVPTWTQATADDWFNGGFITFTEKYVSGTPIRLDFTVTRNNVEEPPKQLDILTSVWREGDIADFGGVANARGNWAADTIYNQKDWVYYVPTGRKFFYKAALATKGIAPPADSGDTYENDYWREYVPVAFSGGSTSRTLVDIPARYWELRAVTDSTTITYTIQGPHNSDSSVAFVSVNAPPGFDQALANALATSGFMTLVDGRLSSTNVVQAEGAVTFTVPHGGIGKHTLAIDDAQGTTNLYIIIGDACVYLTPPVIDTVSNLHGWNAAGGEFGELYTPNYTASKPASYWQTKPGELVKYNGGRYYYPSKPEAADPAQRHLLMDYVYSMGGRYMRMPLKMQRLQHEPFGPLYYGDDVPFTSTSSQDMRRVIEAARTWLTAYPDTRLLFDAHGYGEHTYDLQIDPDDGSMSTQSARIRYDQPLDENRPIVLVDFWVKFVTAMIPELPMKRWDIDFQNEPKEVGSDVAPRQWADIMQWLTNAVRARTGFLGIVHREASEFASAQNFVKNGNAVANLTSYDPARNQVLHLHSYNDKDASGVSGTCAAGSGKARLTAATEWARANGFTRANGSGLFLGETAAGAPSVAGQESCGPIITDELQYVLDNSDVWLGFTWWASGFGTSYPFSLDPSNGNYLNPVHTPNMLMVSGYWKTGNGIAA